MSVPTLYVLHAIRLPSGSGTVIGQLRNVQVDAGLQSVIERSAGLPHPQFTAIGSEAPAIQFTTTQIGTVLGQCSSGKCWGTEDGNIDLYFRKVDALADRVAAATTAHLRMRATKGMLCWRRIRAAHGRTAEIDCTLQFAWDGTNAILTPAGTVALVGSTDGQEQYTLGPMKLNGSTFAGLESVEIDSNADLFVLGSDGEINPTFVGLAEWTPTIRAMVLNSAGWTSYAPVTAMTSWYQYLRKRTPNAKLYADNTNNHIEFSNQLGGTITIEQAAAGTNRPHASTMLRVQPVATAVDGSGLFTTTIGTAIS